MNLFVNVGMGETILCMAFFIILILISISDLYKKKIPDLFCGIIFVIGLEILARGDIVLIQIITASQQIERLFCPVGALEDSHQFLEQGSGLHVLLALECLLGIVIFQLIISTFQYLVILTARDKEQGTNDRTDQFSHYSFLYQVAKLEISAEYGKEIIEI